MDVKIDEEGKEVTLLCLFPEYWDHLFTSIVFSTTETLEYRFIAGPLFSEEVRIKSSIETSRLEGMVVRGQSKERGEKTRGTYRSKSEGKKSKIKCWYYIKLGHIKKDF